MATQLLSEYGSWVPIAIYLVVAAAITLVAVLFLKETKGIALEDVDEADAEERSAEQAARTGVDRHVSGLHGPYAPWSPAAPAGSARRASGTSPPAGRR